MLRLLPALLFAFTLCACDSAAPSTEAEVELYVDGARAGEGATITFPRAIVGKDQLAAQIELKNLGPGALELTGSPRARIENDDRLAFSVTPPPTNRFARGESAIVSVYFRPGSPGENEARVVIEAADREPFIVNLFGDAVREDDVQPVLGVAIDDEAASTRFDFGAIAAGQTSEVTVTLTNVGTGELYFPEVNPVQLAGNGFSVSELTRYSLRKDESAELTLTFAPTACASYGGTLTLRTDTPSGTLAIDLVGRGGTNPQGYEGVTEALSLPDGDVALSNAEAGVRRFVVGNLAVGNYNGRVGIHSWDGCTLGNGKSITPVSAGLSVGLLGAQVAIDDRGKILLATARDNSEAWLFELLADNQARRLAALATSSGGQGNGRGAALAGDASAAFVGVTLADSGFNAHGVVMTYERPATGVWVDLREPRWRLAPSNPTDVQLLGAWVEASADGGVVAAGGFGGMASQQVLGPARIYVWEATGTLGARTWGELPSATLEPDTRVETAQLQAPTGTSDTAALALSRDGATLALPSYDAAGNLLVHVWQRSGASWKTASAPVTVTLSSNVKPRIALGKDGSFFIVADADGAREVLRPDGGWSTSAVAGRKWNVPFYGGITVSSDSEAFVGLDATGRAWLVWR